MTETSAEVFTDPYFGQTEFTEEEIRALTEGKSTSDIDDRARTDYEEYCLSYGSVVLAAGIAIAILTGLLVLKRTRRS